jgi:DNA-directed RNA polymerase subunit RPC12/RpoP
MNHAAIVEKETIFHFTCQECKGWFSIATMEEWQPGKMHSLYCPHCGYKLLLKNNNDS